MAETPMQGLADWLRSQIPPGHNGPYWSRHRRWASEVEAARASPPAPLPDETAMDSKPVAFHDKDQPNGIAWCHGYPEGLKDITPLFAAPPSDTALLTGPNVTGSI